MCSFARLGSIRGSHTFQGKCRFLAASLLGMTVRWVLQLLYESLSSFICLASASIIFIARFAAVIG